MTTRKQPSITLYPHEVRGILEGRQTMIRRIVRQPKGYDSINAISGNAIQWKKPGDLMWQSCPFGAPGDVVWCKEVWRTRQEWDRLAPRDLPIRDEAFPEVHLDFKATIQSGLHGRWRPAISMPRWAARLGLENAGVLVQRVQEISEEDARREGCYASVGCSEWHSQDTAPKGYSYRTAYRTLFDSIHGLGSWDANPFVWGMSFRRIDL